jgi:hypothetical protein
MKTPTKACTLIPKATGLLVQVMPDVEAVEKVPKQIFGRDVEKNDATECATINDLMLGKGQATPENIGAGIGVRSIMFDFG